MAGGVLKGFGVFLMVIGGLAVVTGLFVAAFGAYVVNEESNRGFFANEDKAEGAVTVGLAGLYVAAVGLVFLLLGILLFSMGSSRARREMLEAVQRPVAPAPSPVPLSRGPGDVDAPLAPGYAPAYAPPSEQVPSPAYAPPPPGRPPRPRKDFDWRIPGFVALLALLVLAFLVLAQPQGPLGPNDAPRPSLQSQSFEGTIQGFQTPLTGDNRVTGSPQHEMRLDVAGAYVVRGSVNWTATPNAPRLVLVLEGQAAPGGEWVELAAEDIVPGAVVEAPATPLRNLVRARVWYTGDAGGGSTDYVLTLTAIPSP